MGQVVIEDVVARHYRDVYRYLARTTGSRQLADDLTQDVFLQATRAARDGHSVDHERGWIFAIARTVAAADHRAASRLPAVVHTATEPSVKDRHPAITELADALRYLPALDKEMLLLREIAGLSYEELSLACDCTVEAVRSRLYRARIALRQVLMP